MIVAVVNNKGGVAKTTMSVNLAAALASQRRRVLLVDLDSQASASLWLGASQARLHPSSADCLLNDYPVSQAVRATSTTDLDLLTGSLELANVDLALCDVPGREVVLRNVLRPVRARYDVMILDCPPSLSLIGVNALLAADAFLVPVVPQHLAVEGLVSLLASVDQVRRRLESRVRLLGIVLTMAGAGAAMARVASRVRAQHGEAVFQQAIPTSHHLAEAPGHARTIFEHAPKSSSAAAFRSLASEALDRLRRLKRS